MNKLIAGAVALILCCAVATSAQAMTMTPVSGGPQIVLYFTQSLWSSGKSERLFGVRIDEIRPLPNSPLVTAVGLVQRRELVNLQFIPRSDIRIQLGRRVTWDFSSKEFGSASGRPRVTIGLPITGLKRSQADALQPRDPRTSASILTTVVSFSDQQMP